MGTRGCLAALLFVALVAAVANAQAVGTWEVKASLNTGRSRHSSTKLQDGRVLVVGGYLGTDLHKTCEVYDSELDSWTFVSDLERGRYAHSATLLGDGTVLVSGGYNETDIPYYDDFLGWSERYFPDENYWVTYPMAVGRAYHADVLLANGNVLICGGNIPTQPDRTETCEIFDVPSETWLPSASMNKMRSPVTLTLLHNGDVLAVGGFHRDVMSDMYSSEIYSPSTNSWRLVSSNLTCPRIGHTATLLETGQVLAVGGSWLCLGFNYNNTPSELFDPELNQWFIQDPLVVERRGHSSVILPNNVVLVTGGWAVEELNVGPPHNITEYFLRQTPTSNGTWYSSPSMNIPRTSHTAVVLDNYKVLVIGGDGDEYRSVELFSYEMLPPTPPPPDPTTPVPTTPSPTTPSPTSTTLPTPAPTMDPYKAVSVVLIVSLTTSIVALVAILALVILLIDARRRATAANTDRTPLIA